MDCRVFSAKYESFGMIAVKLLQDVDDFLNYPWGRIVYEATHGSLIGAIENRIALGVKGDHERNNNT